MLLRGMLNETPRITEGVRLGLSELLKGYKLDSDFTVVGNKDNFLN